MYTNSKVIFLTVVVITVMCCNRVLAQSVVKEDTVAKGKNSFVLYFGGGFASYVSSINPPQQILQGSVTKTSAAGTIRVMWHPGYRLRLGIESGYTNFFKYRVKNGEKTGNVTLHAVPILIVWSMPIIKRVNIFAGLGSYLLTTDLQYGSGTVKSQTMSLGSNIALNYIQPISKTMGIAFEAKWMSAFETKDNMLGMQVQLVWKFLE